MRKGLTRAGLHDVGHITDFIEKASDYAFEAVDVEGWELLEWTQNEEVERAREYLNSHRMSLGSLGLSVDWRGSDISFRESIVSFCSEAEVASALGCRCCCTYVLPSVDENPAHFLAKATLRLRCCANILDAYGMRLGLEFVGPHHLRTRWENPFVWELDPMLDWIQAISASNVGLLLDSYHWYTTSNRLKDILRLTSNQIVHVHLNDAPDIPIKDVLDDERLYPGQGVIDSVGFLQALKQVGYSGVVAQEVLTPTPPTLSIDALLKQSKEAFNELWEDAKLSDKESCS